MTNRLFQGKRNRLNSCPKWEQVNPAPGDLVATATFFEEFQIKEWSKEIIFEFWFEVG